MPLAFFGNSAGSYNSAVPFQRIVEPAQLGFFLNLEQAELMRIQRYGEAQRFYLGKHWNFKREDGEPLVTINYIRKLVDKSIEWLAGKGWSIKVPTALVEVTLPFLDEVWRANNHGQLAHDIAQMGGITGDVFVLVTYQEPTPMQRRINPHSKGTIRINLLGSEQVFPTWDPLNVETLLAVRIETIFYAERGTQKLDRDDRANHQGRTLNTKRFTQIITPDQIVEQFHGEQPIVRSNLLGEIPLVHIKNLSMAKEFYGLSDVQDLIDIQREINEKSTDISDVINYQGSPVTVITGAKVKNLERGPKQIWSGLPSDARVANLNLDTDLAASNQYVATLKRALHELSDVPEGSLGQMQPISNTSGTALGMMYHCLQSKTDKKRINYGIGFEQINYFILRIAMVTGQLALPFDLCKRCGGRIVEIETGDWAWVWKEDATHPQGGQHVPERVRKKKCFHIDKQTLDFMRPEEMRLKFIREYGFGTEVREAPFWMIERERLRGNRSFWDYAADDFEAQMQYEKSVAERNKWAANQPQPPTIEMLDEDGNPVPGQSVTPPEMVAPPRLTKLPTEFVDVPEEPETVPVVVRLYHPRTGEVVREGVQSMFLVPTGCQQPEFLNPFENEVAFHDVFPKDEALQAQKFSLYQQNGWVDAEWVRGKIPEIAADQHEIEKRMKNAPQANPENPGGAFQELAPSSETGAGGDQTAVQGQADAQQAGQQQAQEQR